MEEIIYYDHILETLQGTKKSKAKRFVEKNLIENVDYNTYLVHNIPGYNKRTYTVQRIYGKYICNCQYNRIKNEICSHILAVMIYRKNKKIMDLYDYIRR